MYGLGQCTALVSTSPQWQIEGCNLNYPFKRSVSFCIGLQREADGIYGSQREKENWSMAALRCCIVRHVEMLDI